MFNANKHPESRNSNPHARAVTVQICASPEETQTTPGGASIPVPDKPSVMRDLARVARPRQAGTP